LGNSSFSLKNQQPEGWVPSRSSIPCHSSESGKPDKKQKEKEFIY